ncbi:hypothetical protein BJX96DRAFT_176151 [Aspergillus floccosus]
MSSRLTPQAFYGGAITGVIPQGWIDGSALREVPDHQELFLSPTTLSSQIIEINQRVTPSETASILSRLQPSAPTTTPDRDSDTLDKAAALYHLHDLCDENDTLTEVVAPQRVTMRRFPATRAASAFRGVVTMTTPKRARRQRGGSVGGAPAGSSAEGALTTRTSCHYLLVRLEAQETDLLVFVNVPHEEFEASGDPRALAAEEELAEETIAGLVEGLEVVDWGLFV